MNPRQLELFRAIYRLGTVTNAAKVLHISQPAATQAIRRTEDELGFQLFRRVKGRFVPTVEAEALFAETERVYRELDAVQLLARELRDGQSGTLRIAASSPLIMTILPPAITAFRATHPGVRIILHNLPVAEISERLMTGNVDLGLSISPLDIPSIKSETIASTTIVCLLPQDHELARRDVVFAADLANCPIISYSREATPGRLLSSVFREAGLNYRPDIEIAPSITALPLVQRGAGVALVEGFTPWKNFDGIVVRPFHPTIVEHVHLFTVSLRPLSNFAQQFIPILRKTASKAETFLSNKSNESRRLAVQP